MQIKVARGTHQPVSSCARDALPPSDVGCRPARRQRRWATIEELHRCLARKRPPRGAAAEAAHASQFRQPANMTVARGKPNNGNRSRKCNTSHLFLRPAVHRLPQRATRFARGRGLPAPWRIAAHFGRLCGSSCANCWRRLLRAPANSSQISFTADPSLRPKYPLQLVQLPPHTKSRTQKVDEASLHANHARDLRYRLP